MKKLRTFLSSLFITPRLLYLCVGAIFLFVAGYIFEPVFIIGKIYLGALLVALIVDISLLYRRGTQFTAYREMTERFSNGDENPVVIYLENRYPYAVSVKVIDETPVQFQRRDVEFLVRMEPGAFKVLRYTLRPVKRGEYTFGTINVFTAGFFQLAERRHKFSGDVTVPVYPSYIQMRKYELLAISSRLTMAGIKKIRRIGHNIELDYIREYVRGDDPRTVNWKATARRSKLMVNQYMDEKAQPVYSVVDMGRVMKMPFMEMTLLDYAINASLVISNIAILKSDKAGLITFSHKTDSFLKAERNSVQMHKIMDILYRQKTGFLESNYELLYALVKRKINQRSLLLLYTNFESVSSMQRQLPYLRSIAKLHLLVVIFFRNTELKTFLETPAGSMEEVYQKTIAQKFEYEKKQIVKELKAHGIQAVLTTPENLTVDTINKYLELKARGMI